MGQETPSNSLRGSFSQAHRHAPTTVVDTPGPCTYNVAEAEATSAKVSSPYKATIGSSPRHTAEHFAKDSDSPGPSAYNVRGALALRKSVSPRPTIGNSQRSSILGEVDIHSPGPSSYNVNGNTLRPASPRPTIGSSPRDTTEFIVGRGAGEGSMRGRNCRSTGRLPSPRARGS